MNEHTGASKAQHPPGEGVHCQLERLFTPEEEMDEKGAKEGSVLVDNIIEFEKLSQKHVYPNIISQHGLSFRSGWGSYTAA